MKIKSDFVRKVIQSTMVITQKYVYISVPALDPDDPNNAQRDLFILFAAPAEQLRRDQITWKAIGLYNSAGTRI